MTDMAPARDHSRYSRATELVEDEQVAQTLSLRRVVGNFEALMVCTFLCTSVEETARFIQRHKVREVTNPFYFLCQVTWVFAESSVRLPG